MRKMKNILHLLCLLSWAIVVFQPKIAFASGMEVIGYIASVFIIFLGAIIGSFIKFMVLMKAEERGLLIRSTLLVMLAEFAFLLLSCIIGLSLSDINKDFYLLKLAFFSVLIYFVLALYPNLLLFKNKEFREFMLNSSNILNAIIFSAFTPATVLGFFILFVV